MLLFQLRARLVHKSIVGAVPLLNLVRPSTRWPPLEELATYPPSSFGRIIADFLAARGLPFLPQYEGHDALHVLLAYDTDTRGELELQAFMWANGAPSIAGRALFLWGGALLPEYWPHMRRAFARGRMAQRIDPNTLEHLLRTTAEAARAASGLGVRGAVSPP